MPKDMHTLHRGARPTCIQLVVVAAVAVVFFAVGLCTGLFLRRYRSEDARHPARRHRELVGGEPDTATTTATAGAPCARCVRATGPDERTQVQAGHAHPLVTDADRSLRPPTRARPRRRVVPCWAVGTSSDRVGG